MLARVAALVAVLAAASASSTAHADQVEVCASAAERAQSARAQHQLRQASAELRICGQTSCPKFVRNDCVAWQKEVDALAPTVIFRAVDGAGHDVVGVRVAVDGTVLGAVDGAPVILDPGTHHLRFERPSGTPVEQDVVILESQKGRVVTATFPSALPPSSPESGHPVTNPERTERPVPTVTWIASGIAVLGLGAFAGLEVSAQSDYSSAKDGCAATAVCSQGDVDSMRTRFRLAAGALGLGIVSGGVALYTYFTRPRALSAPNAARLPLDLEATPLPGGLSVSSTAHF